MFLLKQREAGTLLLLGHTHSATTTAGGLCVLTAHTQTEREGKGKKKKSIEFKFYSDIHDQRTDKLTSDQSLPPEVPETTVSPDLLQSLQIFSQLVVQAVSEDLKQDRDTTAVTSELTHTLQFKSGPD